nr:hypothetical protein [Tanacetum cinerariifolium]
MDAYRDKRMGDVIVGESFLREVGIKARRFEGIITIYNGNNEVTYQMVRSHPRFKRHTNEQCNKIPPLPKVSDEDKMNGISHPYQKLKGFYKGVLNLGPDYIQDAKMEEWLTPDLCDWKLVSPDFTSSRVSFPSSEWIILVAMPLLSSLRGVKEYSDEVVWNRLYVNYSRDMFCGKIELRGFGDKVIGFGIRNFYLLEGGSSSETFSSEAFSFEAWTTRAVDTGGTYSVIGEV